MNYRMTARLIAIVLRFVALFMLPALVISLILGETGAVWGLAPAILFLLGITDPMLHYRSRGSFQKQKEDE